MTSAAHPEPPDALHSETGRGGERESREGPGGVPAAGPGPGPGPGGGAEPLRDLVEAMDRLRSPGGCPWDAEQTHGSLARYALEETYELVEAIETGDRAGLREELGDVLFQVVFHARVAQEDTDDPFTLDDVAADLVAKLHRRHPHVFGADEYVDAAHLTARWDQIKQEEKARESVFDGVPLEQGALSRAQKVVSRARRAGLPDGGSADASGPAHLTSEDVGAELLAVVRRAQAADVDAEGALRAALRTLETEIRGIEQRAGR